MRARIRPEEALLCAYAVTLVAIMAATGVHAFTSTRHWIFVRCFVALAGAVWVRAYVRARAAAPEASARRRAVAQATRSALGVFRDFVSFFAVLLFYDTLHDLTPVLRPTVVDPVLIAIDRGVLGVDAGVWLGRFATPLLTRAMVLCYGSYFVVPGLLAVLTYWRADRALFRAFMLSQCVVTVVGFAGYVAVPAVGPYVYQSELYPTRLPGPVTTHFFIAAIDQIKGFARDCFPSLHTAHTTVVLWFAWRASRVGFGLYLPVALGLYVSTVYLRMHYVVDVVAGFATAALGVWLGPRLDRWWYRAQPAPGAG